MSSYIMKVGRKTASLTPVEGRRPVEFALGVVDGEAYIGYWEDVDIYDESGDLIKTDTVPVLVFKNMKILYTDENLSQLKMKRASTPVVQDNWWSGKIVEVEPKEYYEEVFGNFKYYIDAPEAHLHFMSLWTIGTIFHPLFNAYPFMYLGGLKRTGKTKVLTLVKLMGFNGIKSHSMSEATIYRLVDSGKATLLLDEQDYLVNPERRAEFRTLLLGGYKKGSFVYRSEKTSKGKIVPTRFKIYSPKALANIEGLEDVLMDRTIRIIMMRSVDPQITRREPDEEDPRWLEMRDKLASLFLNYHKEVSDCYAFILKVLSSECDDLEIPEPLKRAREFIFARSREIWSPILALALFFEKHGVEGLVDKMVDLAKESIIEREMDEVETPEVGLVTALCRMYTGNKYYALSDIVSAFKTETDIERIDPRSVGRMMMRLGFKDKVRRVGRVYYYISDSKLLDLCKRLNITNLEEFAFLSQTLQSSQTAQTLQELLSKALKWCSLRGVFKLEELAEALSVDVKTAEKIVRRLMEDRKVVIHSDGSYRATAS